MEDAIRLVIIVLFIGLIVVAIVFFGIFFLAPLSKVGGILGGKTTSTPAVTLPPLNQNQGQGSTKLVPIGTGGQPSQMPGSSTDENSSSAPEAGAANQTPAAVTGPSLSPGDYHLIDQSSPSSAGQVPADAVKLTVSSSGFSPNVITAKAGAVIKLAVISSDDSTHVFKFDNPDLSSISIGVGPYSMRVLTFTIDKSGIYGFHDDVPGRAQAGVVGRLILN